MPSRMDRKTLMAVANLARLRAAQLGGDPSRDGMERLGAERALMQLADDLEVTAAGELCLKGRQPRRG
jgi:hypothetical protein